MPLNKSLAGKEYETVTYEVTAATIAAYARATNDDNERYLSGDVVASPVFPVVPAFNTIMTAAQDPELEANIVRLVHSAQEHVLRGPIRPGDTLTIRSVLESVEQKETGETFTIASTQENQDGDIVAEVRGTMFIRGGGSGGRPPKRESPAEPVVVHEESTALDSDQTTRYAQASGDHNPIHLDANAAKAAGLPGIINHGMCTMAIAVKGAVNGLANGDPTRIRRCSVRFSRPVLLGQELTTRFWEQRPAGDSVTYGFETYNTRGSAVIKNGIVQVGSP